MTPRPKSPTPASRIESVRRQLVPVALRKLIAAYNRLMSDKNKSSNHRDVNVRALLAMAQSAGSIDDLRHALHHSDRFGDLVELDLVFAVSVRRIREGRADASALGSTDLQVARDVLASWAEAWFSERPPPVVLRIPPAPSAR